MMQIVIDLPNRYYEMVKDFDTVNLGRSQYKGVQYQVINAIKNGIPLPEGHGRLVDEKDLSLVTVHMIDGMFVCDAQTIIEADGGDAE